MSRILELIWKESTEGLHTSLPRTCYSINETQPHTAESTADVRPGKSHPHCTTKTPQTVCNMAFGHLVHSSLRSFSHAVPLA